MIYLTSHDAKTVRRTSMAVRFQSLRLPVQML